MLEYSGNILTYPALNLVFLKSQIFIRVTEVDTVRPIANPSWNFYYKGRSVGVWLNSNTTPIHIQFEEDNYIPETTCDRIRFRSRIYMEYEQELYFLVHTIQCGGATLISGVENSEWNMHPSTNCRS